MEGVYEFSRHLATTTQTTNKIKQNRTKDDYSCRKECQSIIAMD